jgi:hypothetical protein
MAAFRITAPSRRLTIGSLLGAPPRRPEDREHMLDGLRKTGWQGHCHHPTASNQSRNCFSDTPPAYSLAKYRVVVGRCQSGGSHSTSPIQVGQHTRSRGGCVPHLAKAPQPIERADGGVSIVSNTASWRFGFHTFKGGQSEKPSNNMAKKRPRSRDERQCADTVEFAHEMRNLRHRILILKRSD